MVGCERICMLDEYQGYHQVSLARDDQEKVSFITADDAYCYNVMPFGLKNAGATYQRLMNKVFWEQIGHNLEVYVDDILIKLLQAADLCADIEETCRMLRKYRVRLNPQKCLFGAKNGRFLGYIVTEQGIEANSSKLAAQRFLGTFEINNTRLMLYAEAFDKLKSNFGEVVIQKIPRTENQDADELAKLASSITLIVIQEPIEQVSLVAHIDRMEGLAFSSDWRTTIVEFLRSGAAPSDQAEAQLLRKRAGRFTLIGDQLYKKAFSRPLLKCVSSEDAEYILKEVHHGSCGGHPSGRSLAKKILLAGYFWPTL
ncbi:uncharacterized protein K02A2.6-like [Zingiber officinale]|uniref:uncharacterized protein K02A2.6-like n=1 Tax=Zingiber officinale TaxID=94328 RepID=UPI001C4C710F|nr:uncharacterized protein K02A2.6-like [Zingiber officinale]